MDILGRNRAAEELTQEIDAATDVVKNTETEVSGGGFVGEVDERGVVENTQTGVKSEKARNLGNVALRGGSEVQFGFGGKAVWNGQGSEQEERRGTSENGIRQAEHELTRDEVEIEQPEKFVGEETPLLTEERVAEDQADLRREDNLAPKGASEAERRMLAGEHKIVKDAGKVVTLEAMGEVEKILQEKVVHPADLADLWQKRSIEMISKVDGYALGDNN